MNVCIGVAENCKNPESYGTICVKCNMCGRFNKPLSEWTLAEVKTQCSKQISCFVPAPCPFKLDNGNCRVKATPDRFLLSEVDYK